MQGILNSWCTISTLGFGILNGRASIAELQSVNLIFHTNAPRTGESEIENSGRAADVLVRAKRGVARAAEAVSQAASVA